MKSTEKQLTDNEAAAYEIAHSWRDEHDATHKKIADSIANELCCPFQDAEELLKKLVEKGYLKEHPAVVSGVKKLFYIYPLED